MAQKKKVITNQTRKATGFWNFLEIIWPSVFGFERKDAESVYDL